MESLKNKKFDSLESNKINNLSKITGGVIYSAMTGGCYDTFTWTPVTFVSGHTATGQDILSTRNDADNRTWWRNNKDTCI